MLYLDNSATTRINPSVKRVIAEVGDKYFANPSSLHRLGLEAEKLLNKSREVVADSLSVSAGEIIFTSGGTEGDNMALKGIALAYQNRGRHIITTKIEHPAVLNTCQQLAELGFEISYLDVDNEGLINPVNLEQQIREDTILVSIMQVNNEVGSIQPLAEVGKILAKHSRVFFHVDAVQGFAKVPLNLRGWGIDMATISSHKIHGPKGVGALYLRKGIKLEPLLAGGGQEGNLRSGTENLPAIAGFAKAAQIAAEVFSGDSQQMMALKKVFLSRLKDELPQIVINGPRDHLGSPYILNLTVPGLRGEVLLHALEEKEVYVSTGSACSSKKDIYSPVLKAMALDEEIMAGSIRISFTYGTTDKDLEKLLNSLSKSIGELDNRGSFNAKRR